MIIIKRKKEWKASQRNSSNTESDLTFPCDTSGSQGLAPKAGVSPGSPGTAGWPEQQVRDSLLDQCADEHTESEKPEALGWGTQSQAQGSPSPVWLLRVPPALLAPGPPPPLQASQALPPAPHRGLPQSPRVGVLHPGPSSPLHSHAQQAPCLQTSPWGEVCLGEPLWPGTQAAELCANAAGAS